MNPIQHSFQNLNPTSDLEQQTISAAERPRRHRAAGRAALLAAVVACLVITAAAVGVGVHLAATREVEISGVTFHEADVVMDLSAQAVRPEALERLQGVWSDQYSDEYLSAAPAQELIKFPTLEEAEQFLGVELLQSPAMAEDLNYVDIFPLFLAEDTTDMRLNGTAIAPDLLAVRLWCNGDYGVCIYVAVTPSAQSQIAQCGSAVNDGAWQDETVQLDDTFSGLLLTQKQGEGERNRSAAYLLLTHDGIGYYFWYSSYAFDDVSEARTQVLALAENLR